MKKTITLAALLGFSLSTYAGVKVDEFKGTYSVLEIFTPAPLGEGVYLLDRFLYKRVISSPKGEDDQSELFVAEVEPDLRKAQLFTMLQPLMDDSLSESLDFLAEDMGFGKKIKSLYYDKINVFRENDKVFYVDANLKKFPCEDNKKEESKKEDKKLSDYRCQYELRIDSVKTYRQSALKNEVSNLVGKIEKALSKYDPVLDYSSYAVAQDLSSIKSAIFSSPFDEFHKSRTIRNKIDDDIQEVLRDQSISGNFIYSIFNGIVADLERSIK